MGTLTELDAAVRLMIQIIRIEWEIQRTRAPQSPSCRVRANGRPEVGTPFLTASGSLRHAVGASTAAKWHASSERPP